MEQSIIISIGLLTWPPKVEESRQRRAGHAVKDRPLCRLPVVADDGLYRTGPVLVLVQLGYDSTSMACDGPLPQ